MHLHLTALPTQGRVTYGGVPSGFDALLLGYLTKQHGDLLFIATDDQKMAQISDAVGFFYPEVEQIIFPAWDCLPYDRVSPHFSLIANRIEALSRLMVKRTGPRLVMTTISGITQRLAPKSSFKGSVFQAEKGDPLERDTLVAFLENNGFHRAETVMEAGEYAVRGDIIDVFSPAYEQPLRLDLEWDEVSNIRTFDPVDQRTIDQVQRFVLKPVSEVPFDEEAISRFRTQYRKLFTTKATQDPLYEAVSEGRRPQGIEHWLPLFHEKMETLFDYLAHPSKIVLDVDLDQALDTRLSLIEDYYQARADVAQVKMSGEAPYNPLTPSALYLSREEFDERISQYGVADLSPYVSSDSQQVIEVEAKRCLDFSEARANPNENIYDVTQSYIVAQQKAQQKVLIAAYSEGSRDRLSHVLKEHGLSKCVHLDDFKSFKNLAPDQVGIIILGLESGFITKGLTVLSEQDILGERMVRPAKRRLRAENFIAEASSLEEGDLVVHMDHGIGRYEGLETINVGAAPHDCLVLVYDGGDKLFLPVENIELLSRFGSDQGLALLDKLGGVAWQARKAKLKERIKDMAEDLIKVAAARALRKGEPISAPDGVFDEFCSRFSFVETDDQLRAIQETIDDLQSGRPMDRLVCGDVGFGKTEVALRAAFVAAMSGMQVAVVVPTTLLARQHYNNFVARFQDFPIRIAQLSRLVTAKEAKLTKEAMAKGTLDIVVGTHALLAKTIKFDRLGLLIIDEEQHFGVTHKEQLKKLKADVHVLTLTATPIPRTLQMALTGVKEMSLMATPPVDRLAVRTFVTPFDAVVIREAIQRERFRGGQCFYVCPRIKDLDKIAHDLEELVPEAKLAVAHGRMSAKELEEVMNAFAQKEYDILLATNIIESGLDLPSVNTMIIHRADMFGLAQLYQLRGRVGRSKTRAYAYLTLPPGQKISKTAQRRLEVMQTLDSLGAGFSLASHDLDIRGAGNLLGDEQSGHIKEVGIELYQQMLEEAVAQAKGQDEEEGTQNAQWSPQIGIGLPVLIPESYIADLNVRMELYRRVSNLTSRLELDGFAAELVDRFGKIPGEVENLLETVYLKQKCRQAGVEKLDAGPKGAVLKFRDNSFANPDGLVKFLMDQAGTAKMRPDHCLVFMRSWDQLEVRVKGVKALIKELSELAQAG